jgi:hypothetical protein
LSLLVAAAFAATIALMPPWREEALQAEASASGYAPITLSAQPLGMSGEAAKPKDGPAQQDYLAVQKPGPPDPEAQRTAVASAERAAQAAADLAASR